MTTMENRDYTKDVLSSVGHYQDELHKTENILGGSKIPGRGRPKKVYQLNEQQATFLITLLDNTPQVKEFKKALVKAFYSIKQELDQAKLSRELNKRANIGLAETIKAEFPNDKYAYTNYHQLAYKCATGMTPKQLKKVKGVNSPEEALDNDQKERLERAKQHIALYLQDGNDYQDIKKKLLADI